jgi:hypothetical protein
MGPGEIRCLEGPAGMAVQYLPSHAEICSELLNF